MPLTLLGYADPGDRIILSHCVNRRRRSDVKGHFRPISPGRAMSAVTLLATVFATCRMVAKCHERPKCRAPRRRLFNHLVGAQQKRLGDFQPQCLGGLEIDDQLEFGRLLNWQVGRFGAIEDLNDIEGGAPR
jgi:hypothetical protein